MKQNDIVTFRKPHAGKDQAMDRHEYERQQDDP